MEANGQTTTVLAGNAVPDMPLDGPHEAGQERTGPPGALMHILLVEDDESHIEIIRRSFEQQAPQAVLTVTHSVDEARACIDRWRPDLAIADLLLPDGSGMDLVPTDGDQTAFPLVVITAHGDEQTAVASIKAGALDYVIKSEATLADMPHIAGRAMRQWQHILQRREAEERLAESRNRHKSFIDTLPVGLCRKEPGVDGKFMFANPAMAQVFGYEAVEEFLGTSMGDYFVDIAEWRAMHHTLMSEGVVVRQEARLKRKDGTLRWGVITASVVRNSSGEVMHVDVLIDDTTERKALESQLAQAQKLEAMGQLAAGIAHEINTPIQYVGDNTRFVGDSVGDLFALVRAYEQVLNDADLPSGVRTKVEAAAENADLEYLVEEIPTAISQSLEGVARVVAIVRAMKEFSHPDTSEKTSMDINKIIDSTVTLARNEWKYVADMEMDLDPEMPLVPMLVGDIKQVVLNILVNAAHAIADAPGEKGVITVATRHEGQWAEIRISDTGTGIPEQAQPKIFDLFFTTKAVGKGTGQGLAISRAVVVEKHGGTITFESESGKGTTFIIRLPLDATPTGEEPGK